MNELSLEARYLLECPKKEKTKKIYAWYFKLYERNCKKHKLTIYTEPLVIDFMMQMKKKFSKGMLWSIYSCLNHNFQVKKEQILRISQD